MHILHELFLIMTILHEELQRLGYKRIVMLFVICIIKLSYPKVIGLASLTPLHPTQFMQRTCVPYPWPPIYSHPAPHQFVQMTYTIALSFCLDNKGFLFEFQLHLNILKLWGFHSQCTYYIINNSNWLCTMC